MSRRASRGTGLLLLLALTAGSALLLRPSRAGTAEFTYFPTPSTTDGRMLSLGGAPGATIAGLPNTIRITVPAGTTSFEIGIFDGETGGTSVDPRFPSPVPHWDFGNAEVIYRLIADPDGDGTGTELARWHGNATNLAAGGVVTSVSAPSMPDNDWWTAVIAPSTAARRADGSFVYLLEGILSQPEALAFSN